MRRRTSFHPDELTPDIRQAETPPMLKQASQRNAQDGSTEPGATRSAGGGMLHPFTVRNFTLLFGGQTISVIGDARIGTIWMNYWHIRNTPCSVPTCQNLGT